MYGTIGGNVIGILYFMVYQILGISFASLFVQKEKKELQLLIGSITGSVALHWFPILVSFVMDFNVKSHIIGLLLFVLVILLVRVGTFKQKVFGADVKKGDGMVGSLKQLGHSVKTEPAYWIMFVVFVFYTALVLNHSFPMKDGAMYAGQCSYGDMNMHLGFITSIANQGTFPPDYSILPGVKLAYPFLCDSISSSVYVFGASLRVAYILPMLLAILQVFLGAYCLGKAVLKDKAKACLGWVLFFFNGGFGFVYFMDLYKQNPENFKRIFSAFYETPTNLVDYNVRWTNVIADMLLPQRATLFGWAILFGTLALLYYAIEQKNVRYFILAGIFGGALPLVHTHSFLALGIICIVWLIADMFRLSGGDMERENRIAKYLVPIGLVVMCVLQMCDIFVNNIETTGMMMVAIILGAVIGVMVYYAVKLIKQEKWKPILMTWGIFLVVVLILAAPQLFGWTFQQVGNGDTLKGNFNWANESDQYLWFYLKNIGLMAIFAVPAFVYAKRKKFFMAAPALLIWAIAEFMIFQPNVYDNNKLLYVGYILICFLVADVMWELFKKLYAYRKVGSIVLGVFVLVICMTSAVLTLGREYASGAEYELYSKDQVALCEYIEEHTEASSVILTNGRHNNAVSSLTGRNIVCGTGTFLYYHGLDYLGREQEVTNMYTDPAGTTDLMEKYNVSYILVGPDERSSYAVDEAAIQSMGECVFSQNDVQLYKIK